MRKVLYRECSGWRVGVHLEISGHRESHASGVLMLGLEMTRWPTPKFHIESLGVDTHSPRSIG